MGLLVSLADLRDIVVIVYGIAGIVLFAVLLVIAVGIYFAFRGLHHTVKELIDDSVRPTLGSIRDTADTIRGTTDFMGQKAVSPVIRTYGMASGVKRGLGVLSGLTKRKRE